MDETNTLWIAVAVALAVGGLIGFLMGRSGSGADQQQTLSKELESTKEELETYKRKVTDHFEETATLVGNLTDSYKAVHTHLAGSSRDLCDNDHAAQVIEAAMNPSIEHSSATETETTPAASTEEETASAPKPLSEEELRAPPLDYAPKSDDEEGTLSETYGLKSDEKPVERPADYTAPAEEAKSEKKD